jgi:hypothetical protein
MDTSSSQSALESALMDGCCTIVRAMAAHATHMAARCCVSQGDIGEHQDRQKLADWLELIALQVAMCECVCVSLCMRA